MRPQGVNDYIEEISVLVSQMMNQNPISIEPIKGGKNNQTFKVKLSDRTVVLKRYFGHPSDKIDRLRQEFTFLGYLWNSGNRSVPEPIASSSKGRAACYSFIEGTPMSGPIDEGCVEALGKFFAACNCDRFSSSAQAIYPAADAFFSIQDLFISVRQRVYNLREHIAPPDIAPKYSALLDTLLSLLDRYEDWILNRDAGWGQPLPAMLKFLSPSDFGFHNALRSSNGDIFFIDFEYAGWDDPGRALCDVFLQPQVPVDVRFQDCFLRHAFSDPEIIEFIHSRGVHLLPLASIRWCCIILNEFSAIGFARRSYAGHPPSDKVLNEKYDIAARRASEIERLIL